jgi:hypothetical protein
MNFGITLQLRTLTYLCTNFNKSNNVTFDELKNSKTFQNSSKQIIAYKRGALRSLKTQNLKILMHKLW